MSTWETGLTHLTVKMNLAKPTDLVDEFLQVLKKTSELEELQLADFQEYSEQRTSDELFKHLKNAIETLDERMSRSLAMAYETHL